MRVERGFAALGDFQKDIGWIFTGDKSPAYHFVPFEDVR